MIDLDRIREEFGTGWYKTPAGLTFLYLEIETLYREWYEGGVTALMFNWLDLGFQSLINGFNAGIWPIYWLMRLSGGFRDASETMPVDPETSGEVTSYLSDYVLGVGPGNLLLGLA